jgi:hypothetical protein
VGNGMGGGAGRFFGGGQSGHGKKRLT